MDSAEKEENSKGPKLEWMYKPSALVDREDYLTGRSVDKSLKLLDEIEKGTNPSEFSYLNEVEKDLTPASIFTSQGSGPLDLIKKIKDDPLYQIQKKEQESLKQLLKNPVKMKQLNRLIESRQVEVASSSHKHKRKKSNDKKHKRSKRDRSGDDDDTSRKRREDSSDRERKTSGHRHRKRRKSDTSDSGSESHCKSKKSYESVRRKHEKRGPSESDEDEREKRRKEIIEKFKRKATERNFAPKRIENDKTSNPSSSSSRAKKLTEDELEKKRKEMMENAKWREQQRSNNISKYRDEEKKEEERSKKKNPDFIRKQLLEAANSGSVEQRVKSNSYNIQRSHNSMDKNFLKR